MATSMATAVPLVPADRLKPPDVAALMVWPFPLGVGASWGPNTPASASTPMVEVSIRLPRRLRRDRRPVLGVRGDDGQQVGRVGGEGRLVCRLQEGVALGDALRVQEVSAA